jgi:hypothetical protein
MTTQQIIINATNTNHGSHVAAAAAAFLGHNAHSLCCWCLEADRSLDDASAHRLPAGGECERCSYVGRDALLVVA